MNQYLKDHTTQILLGVLAVIVGINLINAFHLLEPDPLSIEPVNGIEHVTVKAGEIFYFERAVCVKRDTVVTTQREFRTVEGEHRATLPAVSYVGYAADGCYTAEFSSQVPIGLAAGEYVYRPILIYNVNPVLQISKPAPVVRLTVVE